jgi:uncharacterized membrane protein
MKLHRPERLFAAATRIVSRLGQPMHGARLWEGHPGVRTGDQLTVGERAADRLKATFGSWTFLMLLNGFIVVWISVNLLIPRPFDPYPFILLNLGLSWLAAQQGGALQIAANRGDRISSEVALHTQANSDALIDMNRQQLAILQELRELRSMVAGKDGTT